MANLGFIGLGVMGSRMVKRLLDAGHTITGYNRTKAKAQWLLDVGMRWSDTPRAVAQTADMVLSMVANTEALQAVTGGPDGMVAGLSPGAVFIDMSTVSPAASRALAEQVAATGAHMLDAPVSGSVTTLEAGKLSFMVGGQRAIYERALPILRDIGPKATELGITYPAGFTDDRGVVQDYQILGMPTTVFINPDGTIFEKWTGALNRRVLVQKVEQMEALQ